MMGNLTQHAAFAHTSLSRLFFADTGRFQKLLAKHGDRLLSQVWRSAGELSGSDDAAELQHTTYDIDGYRVTLVVLPPADQPGVPRCVAMVTGEKPPRLFVLEESENGQGVVTERGANRQRRLGVTPQVTRAALMGLLRQRLARSTAKNPERQMSSAAARPARVTAPPRLPKPRTTADDGVEEGAYKGKLSSFRSQSVLTPILVLLIAVNAVLVAACSVATSRMVSLVERMQQGEPLRAKLSELVDFGTALATLEGAASLLVSVLFVTWLVRASRNARDLGARKMRYTPGSAGICWFIGYVRIFTCGPVLNEIWKASSPGRGGLAWQSNGTLLAVDAYWFVWVCSFALGRFGNGDTTTGLNCLVASGCGHAVALGLLSLVVCSIRRRQMEEYDVA